MLFHRGYKHAQSPSFSIRTSRFIDREFQLKYTSVVLTAALIGIAVTVFPVYYFLIENYKIFVDIAFEQAPRTLQYLEREKTWVVLFLITGSTGTLCFFWYLGLKLTSRIVGPIQVMTNHLRGLSRGKWDQPPIKIRADDEFHDLIDSYNYFYDSFKVNLQRDLDFLRSLAIDPNNKDAYLAWNQMILEKSTQLNKAESVSHFTINSSNASKPSEPPGQRHVS